MSDILNYRLRTARAMKWMVREVLRDIAKEGLPGDHHFYITFDTTHPGVDIADWLRDRYPSDMTIVIQHWFDNLMVLDDRFSIELNFNNSAEPLVIPFGSLRLFSDPSVDFALNFKPEDEIGQKIGGSDKTDVTGWDLPMEEEAEAEPLEAVPSETEGRVVSLDKFREKK